MKTLKFHREKQTLELSELTGAKRLTGNVRPRTNLPARTDQAVAETDQQLAVYGAEQVRPKLESEASTALGQQVTGVI